MSVFSYSRVTGADNRILKGDSPERSAAVSSIARHMAASVVATIATSEFIQTAYMIIN